MQQYRRRLLIALNRHTAPHYFRCMGELASPKWDRPKRQAQATRSKMIGYKMQAPCMGGIEVRTLRQIWRKDVLPAHGRHLFESPDWGSRDDLRVLPAHGWHRPFDSGFRIKAIPETGEKTSIPKMELDKTGSVAAAVLQPLAGVATPVQSMNRLTI